MDIRLRYPTMSTLAEVEGVIAGAIAAAKTMKQKVQYAAIGIMILAAKEGKTGDGMPFAEKAIELANYLVEQVGAGIKGEGLVKFLVYKCGFKVNEAAKKEGFIEVRGSDWIKEHLEAAKDVPWWTYAPAMPFAGFNLFEDMKKSIKRAENAIKQAGDDKEKLKLLEVDGDMLETLRALVGGKAVTSDNALRLVTRLIPEQEEPAKKEATG